MFRALTFLITIGLSITTQADFQAGAEKIDITPKLGLTSWGYSPPPTMDGVLDPLYAKAIVIRSGDSTIAMVTLDLGRVLIPSLLEEIRDRVKAKSVDHVMFTASHTHQAPPVDIDSD